VLRPLLSTCVEHTDGCQCPPLPAAKHGLQAGQAEGAEHQPACYEVAGPAVHLMQDANQGVLAGQAVAHIKYLDKERRWGAGGQGQDEFKHQQCPGPKTSLHPCISNSHSIHTFLNLHLVYVSPILLKLHSALVVGIRGQRAGGRKKNVIRGLFQGTTCCRQDQVKLWCPIYPETLTASTHLDPLNTPLWTW
jgi:hypothetical protein